MPLKVFTQINFVADFIRSFQVEGDIAQQPMFIALSCGIKISAVCSFISSQSTCVMDRQTELLTQYCASIAASCSKNASSAKGKHMNNEKV